MSRSVWQKLKARLGERLDARIVALVALIVALGLSPVIWDHAQRLWAFGHGVPAQAVVTRITHCTGFGGGLNGQVELTLAYQTVTGVTRMVTESSCHPNHATIGQVLAVSYLPSAESVVVTPYDREQFASWIYVTLMLVLAVALSACFVLEAAWHIFFGSTRQVQWTLGVVVVALGVLLVVGFVVGLNGAALGSFQAYWQAGTASTRARVTQVSDCTIGEDAVPAHEPTVTFVDRAGATQSITLPDCGDHRVGDTLVLTYVVADPSILPDHGGLFWMWVWGIAVAALDVALVLGAGALVADAGRIPIPLWANRPKRSLMGNPRQRDA